MKSFKFISVLLYAFLVAGMDQKSDNAAIIPYKSEQNRNNPFIKMCRDKEILKIIFSFLYGDQNMKKLIDQIPSKIIYSQILKIYRESLVPTDNPFNFSTEKILRLALRNSDFENIKISNPQTRVSIQDATKRLETSAKTVEQKKKKNLMFAPLVCIYGLFIVGSVLFIRSAHLERINLPQEELSNLFRPLHCVVLVPCTYENDFFLGLNIGLGVGSIHGFIFIGLGIYNLYFPWFQRPLLNTVFSGLLSYLFLLMVALLPHSSHFAARVLRFGNTHSVQRMFNNFMLPTASVFLCVNTVFIIFMNFQYKDLRRNQNLRNRINNFIQNKF
jgi:hypothetical protein